MTRALGLVLLLVMVSTSGCSAVNFNPFTYTPAPLPQITNTSTPRLTPTNIPTSTPTPIPAEIAKTLTIWVLPDFNLNESSPANDLLKDRLYSFTRLYPGVQVQVRVKAGSGPGNMLDSLATAGAAAPLALPSLVLLGRADLETAAVKGLIYQLSKSTGEIDQADWYSYARQLASVQGSIYGLPFAGDALALVYRPSRSGGIPADWQTILQLGQVVIFPAADPSAVVAMGMYQSAGGNVEDAQHRPILQAEPLTQVYKLFSDGTQRNIFPYWITGYESGQQVWQGYREQKAHIAITWASLYLSALPADSAVRPLPPIGSASLTPATGWMWAVADPLPERREMAIRLAEFLVAPDFLAKWTQLSGYLPTRPSAMAQWQNQSLQNIFSQVLLSAQARPANDLIFSVGPILKEGTVKVIQRESDPLKAAQAAAERLAIPTSR